MTLRDFGRYIFRGVSQSRVHQTNSNSAALHEPRVYKLPAHLYDSGSTFLKQCCSNLAQDVLAFSKYQGVTSVLHKCIWVESMQNVSGVLKKEKQQRNNKEHFAAYLRVALCSRFSFKALFSPGWGKLVLPPEDPRHLRKA